MGCSDHSVPSLSKTAMRSAAGTKSAPPWVVTRETKSRMAFLDAPSFQEGSGSALDDCASSRLGAATRRAPSTNVDATSVTTSRVFKVIPPIPAHLARDELSLDHRTLVSSSPACARSTRLPTAHIGNLCEMSPCLVAFHGEHSADSSRNTMG